MPNFSGVSLQVNGDIIVHRSLQNVTSTEICRLQEKMSMTFRMFVYKEAFCIFLYRNVPLRSDKCDGPARIYRSCNIQDCPEGSKDFREEQCASFNEVPHGGVIYKWVPFLGGKQTWH